MRVCGRGDAGGKGDGDGGTVGWAGEGDECWPDVEDVDG
jgi:hypothetical protein